MSIFDQKDLREMILEHLDPVSYIQFVKVGSHLFYINGKWAYPEQYKRKCEEYDKYNYDKLFLEVLEDYDGCFWDRHNQLGTYDDNYDDYYGSPHDYSKSKIIRGGN